MSRTHNSTATDDRHDRDKFLHQFTIFETTLMALLRDFFHTIEELDDILADANQ